MAKRIFIVLLGLIMAGFMIWAYSADAAPAEDELVQEHDQSVMLFRLVSTILLGAYVGMLFVLYVLPMVTEKLSHLILADSGMRVEDDGMGDARAAVARGDYVEAIGEYRRVLQKEPKRRLAWLEIARLQLEEFENGELAISTLEEGLKLGGWREDDEVVFRFRIADLLESVRGDEAASRNMLESVQERFPSTGHALQASHRLSKLGESGG